MDLPPWAITGEDGSTLSLDPDSYAALFNEVYEIIIGGDGALTTTNELVDALGRRHHADLRHCSERVAAVAAEVADFVREMDKHEDEEEGADWDGDGGRWDGHLAFDREAASLTLALEDKLVLDQALAVPAEVGRLARLCAGGCDLPPSASRKLHVIRSRREAEAAAEVILEHARALPICAVDAGGRDYAREGGHPELPLVEEERGSVVALSTGKGHTYIYILAGRSAATALGGRVTSLLQGKSEEVTSCYVVAEGRAAEELKIKMAVDPARILQEWQSAGFAKTSLAPPLGPEDVVFAVHGRCLKMVMPSRYGMDDERAAIVSRYGPGADPGPDPGEVPPSRDLRTFVGLAGRLASGGAAAAAARIALDALAGVCAVYCEVARHLQAGNGRGMNLQNHLTRACFDARASNGAVGAPGAGVPGLEGALKEARLADERRRQGRLPPDLGARRRLATESYLSSVPAEKRDFWARTTRAAAAGEGGPSVSASKRLRMYGDPYIGGKPAPEEDGCGRCGRHRRGEECFVKWSCCYVLCDDPSGHDVGVCKQLHSSCGRCGYKGHGPDYDCDDPEILKVLVRAQMEWSHLGRHTRHGRHRPAHGALSFSKGELPSWYRLDEEALFEDPLGARARLRRKMLAGGAVTDRPRYSARADGSTSKSKEKRERRLRAVRAFLRDGKNKSLQLRLEDQGDDLDVFTGREKARARRRRYLRNAVLRKRAATAAAATAGEETGGERN